MSQNFQIIAIDKKPFNRLMSEKNKTLANLNIKWITADAKPGYPCRVSLVDAEVGERVLLLPFVHHDVDSPYKASGAIFIRENAELATLRVNQIPDMLLHRSLSVRTYNSSGFMVGAEVIEGSDLRVTIEKQFEKVEAAYIHIHNAGPGCFNCAVYRA